MEDKLTKLEREVAELKDIVYKNAFPSSKVFEQQVSCNDVLNIRKVIRFFNGSEIASGDEINDAGIKAEMGYTAPNGSLYLSTSASQPFFVMVGTTWTLVTLP